jgi:hypothetical protein
MEPIATANAIVLTPTSANTMVEVASDDDEHDKGILVFSLKLLIVVLVTAVQKIELVVVRVLLEDDKAGTRIPYGRGKREGVKLLFRGSLYLEAGLYI